MKRRTAALLAAILLITAILTGAAGGEEEYYTLYVICRPDSFVYVREHPKKTAKEAGYLECGTKVLTMGERRGQYMRIYEPTFEGGEYWIHAGYLVEDEPQILKGQLYQVTSKGRVALRRFVNGPRRAWIKPGKTLKVYAITDEWALTNRGFIRREYIEEVEEKKGAWIRLWTRKIGLSRSGWRSAA